MQNSYIFSQLVKFLDRNHFNHLVRKYEGDRYVKHFTYWNHLLVMIFGQLCNRESLRDLVNVVSAHKNKSYHLGFGKMFQKPIWHMPTISGITTSLRIMPTT